MLRTQINRPNEQRPWWSSRCFEGSLVTAISALAGRILTRDSFLSKGLLALSAGFLSVGFLQLGVRRYIQPSDKKTIQESSVQTDEEQPKTARAPVAVVHFSKSALTDQILELQKEIQTLKTELAQGKGQAKKTGEPLPTEDSLKDKLQKLEVRYQKTIEEKNEKIRGLEVQILQLQADLSVFLYPRGDV